MRKVIFADELRAIMYHEAFETDTNLQKWDSGCWIRFKLFENAIDGVPKVIFSNREWIDFLSDQFNVSRTTAREMLHALMRWKKEDNFKKQFSGKGETKQ